MDYDMIPIVDLSESGKLGKELRAHPLAKRRSEVEHAFLDELTRLTRKYGLALEVDSRNEYGETYPECNLKTPYEGTEARYVFSDYSGIDFASMKAKGVLPCSPEEIKQYEVAKKMRAEEDKVIGDLQRKVSKAHWDAMQKGHMDMMQRVAAKYAAQPQPKNVECSCGAKFKDEAKLKAHATKTGHRA